MEWRLFRLLRGSAGSSRSAEETLWRDFPSAPGVAVAADGAGSPPRHVQLPPVRLREQWSPSPRSAPPAGPAAAVTQRRGRGAQRNTPFKVGSLNSKRNSLRW